MTDYGFLTDDLKARVEALPPQRRALFAQLLAERGRAGIHELSVTQQGLWFLDKVNPRSPLYTIAWRCELRGALDAEAFARAVQAVVARHDALRTRFDVVDGRPVQVVEPAARVAVAVEDLTGRPADERATRADERITALTGVGFDLSRAPLLRVTLFRLAANRHLMLLMAHHIVFDYVSTDILLEELIRGYGAEVGARADDLPPLPIQYGDFARWQRDHLRGARLTALTDYWTRQLDGADDVLDLPTDRPRPAVQTFDGGAYRFVIPAAVLEPLRGLARRERATLFMVYLAGFQALLHRYTDAPAVNVGLAVDARTRAELRRLIGFFINSVVVRTDLSGNPTFCDLLDRVRRTCLDAYEHQDLPFDQVVEAVAPTRSLSCNPLFQVTCALDEESSLGLSDGGIEVTSLDGLHTGQAKFDLSFGGTLRDGTARISVDYNRDLFDEATVARMARHLVALLTAAGRDPRRPIRDLPLLDDRELADLLAWGAGPAAGAAPDPLEAFDRRAGATPDALAVDDGAVRLNYGDLVRRVSAAADQLAAAGVRAGTAVAIAPGRGADQLVQVLAALRIGAVVTPAGAPYPTPAATPRGAYLVRTAGTTGPARTVVVSRTALAASVARYGAALGVHAADRVAWLADLGTDEAVPTICLALSAGAGLCPVAPTAAAVADAARDGRVTLAIVPPAAARELSAAAVGDLRVAVAVGDPLVGAAGRRWAGRTDGRSLRAYSTAETGVAAWTAVSPGGGEPVALGCPAPGTRLYVLDGQLRLQPVGVPGDLYVGGDGVALGYHAEPGQTATAFLPDPFAAKPGARMVRTGDRARWLADGTLMFVGRAGPPWSEGPGRPLPYLRIEAAITEHPAVSDAAVVVFRRRHGAPVRTAYVVAHPGSTAPGLRELQRFLAGAVPDYLMPAAVVAVDRLPYGPTARMDLAALASPDPATAAADRTVAPRTAAERVLAGAWSQLLGVADVGAEDSFFDLGGHSLLAVQLLAHVGELFRVELEMSLLFRAATPATMAAELADRLGGAEALESIAETVEAVLSMSDEELVARLAETGPAAAGEAS